MPSVKPGQPLPKKLHLARTGDSVTSLLGKVNDTECMIIPDTGADITIVPGKLVLASQLLNEFELVRGVRESCESTMCKSPNHI